MLGSGKPHSVTSERTRKITGSQSHPFRHLQTANRLSDSLFVEISAAIAANGISDVNAFVRFAGALRQRCQWWENAINGATDFTE